MDTEHGPTLAPLSELDFTVEEGSPDVRGWEVVAADGITVGTVVDLLVDTATLEVRHLLAALDAQRAPDAPIRMVRVPIADTRLSSPERKVHLDTLSASRAADLPPYPEPADPLGDRTVPDARPDGLGVDQEARMTLSQEELDVRKRVVETGEVEVQKRVETEHVRRVVPRVRERATVRRRPVPPGLTDFRPRMEGDVIYVPLVEEELIVEKRLVAREELVIVKERVVDEQVVEETLRREVADVRETE